MFGLCPNILSLLQFSLVFIPLCPNFVVLFLQEFLSDQLQISAQWSFGSGEMCYDFSKSYTMLYIFSWSLYGAMSNFDRLFLLEFLSNRHQTLAQWSLCIEVFCYDFFKNSQLLFRMYPGFSGSLCGSMSIERCTCWVKPHEWNHDRDPLSDAGDTTDLHLIVEIHISNDVSCGASVSASGPALNQHWAFDMDSKTFKMLHLTFTWEL